MHSWQNQLQMSSGTLYHLVLIRTDVSENISPPSSGFLTVTALDSCVTMESQADQPLHRGILCIVEEHCLLECVHGGINY
jgi:hypothetical protein